MNKNDKEQVITILRRTVQVAEEIKKVNLHDAELGSEEAALRVRYEQGRIDAAADIINFVRGL